MDERKIDKIDRLVQFQSSIQRDVAKIEQMATEKDSYLCSTIRQYIKDTKSALTSIYNFVDPDIRVLIWSPTDESAYDHEYTARMIHVLTRWIRQLKWSTTHTGRETWEIDVYLTPAKKTVCPHDTNNKSKPTVIGICHANSGETLTQVGRKIHIRVVRAECVIRTIIHELLHAHDWDRLVSARGKGIYDTESLVETTARILYCQWFAREQWQSMLEDEIRHAQQQLDQLRRIRWTSETHVVPYYYTTTTLLTSWTHFWTWLWTRTSTSNAQHTWDDLKQNCWTRFFHEPYRIRSSSEELAKQVQLPEDKSSLCFSLRMVRYQVNLSAARQYSFVTPFPVDTRVSMRKSQIRSGGGSSSFWNWFREDSDSATRLRYPHTVMAAPESTVQVSESVPSGQAPWFVTHGQARITFGPDFDPKQGQWVGRGQRLVFSQDQPIRWRARNDNRWYPFVIVQIDQTQVKHESLESLASNSKSDKTMT